MSKFQESLRLGKFLVTVQAFPPKGVNWEPFVGSLERFAGKVDAVNVPDSRAAGIHLGGLAASLLLKEKGVEPIMVLSCRDRNRLAMSSDLLGAYSMGIRNLLCVSGDYFTYGDTPDAKPVYDLDSVQAIQMIREMEQGRDIGGNELDGVPSFCVGCVANPHAEPIEPMLLKLEKKVRAGAEFVQTLDVYDWGKTRPFFDFAKERDLKVLVGVRLITQKEVKLWEAGKMPGNPIPEHWRTQLNQLEDETSVRKQARGRMVAMIREVKESGLAAGVHLTLAGNEEMLPEILKEAGI